MKNKKLNVFIILLMIGMLLPLCIFSQEVIEIQVSPNVLNLQNNGVVVTIHTDIPYSAVIGSSVSLNGLEIESWKSDNQGYFVAKFNMDEVKQLEGLEVGGYNTLTLSGETGNGTFTGSDEILVINNIPNKKK
ncbi:MAG: hypothetical protein KQH67_02490 [Bacteroidetes bacterium]|nr:hypothetical protein [Bacteroidota bacterium]